MEKKTQVFITFEQFISDIGIQRPMEGKKTQVLPRYLYLNRALDILLENPEILIKNIYCIIAKEQNVSEEIVKKEMLLAMKQIFLRRYQKEEFTKIFENNKISDIELFLRKIITAYKKRISKK